jgi:proteasome lid subunit RPN8/RPN11
MKQSDFDKIVAYARAGLPNEVCGLIAGKDCGNERTVEKVYPLPNTDKSPEHFVIDPIDQLAAIRDMRQNGLVPLGNFHSHPSTPARPSDEDLRFAYDSKASYLILSLAKGEPELKAFRVENRVVEPDTVDIILDREID